VEVRVGDDKQFVTQIPLRDWHVGASRRGTAPDEIGDQRDSFSRGDHTHEVIEVQGGGAKTRIESGFATDLLRPGAMCLGAIIMNMKKCSSIRSCKRIAGPTRERMFRNE